MSNAILSASASGSGSVTLLAPVTNSTQTLTLPDATGTVVSTGSTAVVTAPLLNGAQTGSAAIYGVRAWVNFNGTGTVAIRGSGNVSSITDNGTGDYTVNFTTAMPDANYAIGLSGSAGNGEGFTGQQNVNLDPNVAPTASACGIRTSNSISGGFVDYLHVTAMFIR
jgi:uncharacterized protein (AIM24 family)